MIQKKTLIELSTFKIIVILSLLIIFFLNLIKLEQDDAVKNTY